MMSSSTRSGPLSKAMSWQTDMSHRLPGDVAQGVLEPGQAGQQQAGHLDLVTPTSSAICDWASLPM